MKDIINPNIRNPNIRNPKGAGRKRKLTPLEEANCYKDYMSGRRPEEIAFRNGISASTLQRIIKEQREKEERQ